jgi:hypothetical protein
MGLVPHSSQRRQSTLIRVRVAPIVVGAGHDLHLIGAKISYKACCAGLLRLTHAPSMVV